MKKVTFLLLLLVFSVQAIAQVLNQPANWPNTNWTITGTYVTGATIFEADPTLTANFAYDDDDAGAGANNDISAESPVIDLTAAFDAGETWLFLNATYVYNNIGADNITIQYWDADASTWNNWGDPINADTPGAPTNNFCDGTSAPFESGELNIAGFSATQLSGFKYRIKYDDGDSWAWGFCFSSPTITSQSPPACSVITGLTVGTVTSTTAELSWNPGVSETAWEIVVQPAGSGAPSGNGESTTLNSPYTAMTLDPATNYEAYVRADCGSDGFSDWVGPIEFLTDCAVFTPDYLATFDTFLEVCWVEADSGDPSTGPMNLGTGSWVADGFANNGTTGANKINLWLAEKRDWLLSPEFDLTGGPFQVELDFAIMQYASSTNAGTLGSDDEVQFLITNDNGVTWTALNIWNNTTAVPAGGQHYVYNLAAYSGQTVQFAVWASEGTVDDSTDIDVSFDNFQVRAVPTCPEPTALMSTNLSLTSTEVSWTENGGSTIWNIEYGLSGFTQGTGTVVTGVTNPYVIPNLTPDTSYDFYVQADCGAADGLSSWSGPASFYTGYCTSVPTSNDGQGVSNVSLGVTDFPSFGDVTYENHTATTVNAFQGVETNLAITFGTGYTYDSNVWIDFNDNLVFEASELVSQGTSTAANPTTLDISFTMPADAALGQHRMRIGTADSGQANPNPCYSGSFGVTLDFTINILVLDCELPTATYEATPDCDGNQFFVNVEITSLGDASSLEISNSLNADTTQATVTGNYEIGPFAFGSTVRVFVMNEQNNNCVISSPNFSILACPPANDSCSGAITASVNSDDSCTLVTAGTILAATPSGVTPGMCSGNPDDDVWFQFTATGDQHIISLQNLSGGTTNVDHAVYSGSCGSLVELYCSPDTTSVTPQMTLGETYYVRVFSAGSAAETTTFNLCISTLPPPTFCSEALPICAGISYPSNTGDEVASPYLDYGCLGSQPDPTWNTLLFDVAGDYVFTLNQVTTNPSDNADVDFIVWGPFNSQQEGCFDLLPETQVDCSFSASETEEITINGVQAGDIYVLLITNYGQAGGTFTFTQDIGPAAGTNCDVVCDANIVYDTVTVVEDENNPGFGEPIELCGASSITLTASSPYADTFEWYEDNIPLGVSTQTLTVTESGVYRVEVSGDVCEDSALSIQVPVNFIQEPVVNPVMDIVTCDDISGDGFETFNLDSQTEIILGDQDPDLFNVTYHLTLADAANNVGALTSPYTNITSPQQIWIRIENVNSTTCADNSSSFNIVVSGVTPTATSVDLSLCDDLSDDGFEAFDLTSNDANILNGQSATDFTVTYYATMEDADDQTSPLTSVYTNTTNPQTIYARVDNNAAVDCYAVAEFDLIVDGLPMSTFATDFDYEVCPNATEPITITVTPQNYSASDVSVVWYQDGGVITGQNGLNLPVLTQGFYEIEVTSNASGCSYVVGQQVIELDNCIIPQGISPDGDGKNDTFDLSNFGVKKIEIFNRLGTLVYSKENYTNEWHGQSNSGDELPVGTYFYTMIYEGGAKQHSAWVYLNK